MADDISISTDGTSITAPGKPVVLNERFIDLVAHDGEGEVVIGRVRAEFYFSQVPPELHCIVLSYLMGASQSWHVGSVIRGPLPPMIERRPARKADVTPTPDVRWEPWWQAWMRKLWWGR